MQLKQLIRVLLLVATAVQPVVLGLALWAANDVAREVAEVGSAEAFIKSAAELRLIAMETAQFHEERSGDQWRRKIASMRAELQRIPVDNEWDHGSIQRVRDRLDSAQLVYDRLSQVPARKTSIDPAKTADLALNMEGRSIASLLVLTSEIADTGYVLIAQEREQMLGALHRIQWAISAIVLAMVALMVALWRIADRRVLAPLAQFEESTRRVANGDYTARLNFRYPDEIGRLAQAFDTLTERMQLAMLGQQQLNANLTLNNTALRAAVRDNDALLSALNMHAIVSVADGMGMITEVNDSFCNISAYSRQELIGASHNIVKSGVQDREFWDTMWHTIAQGTPWRGQVCNRAKDGTLYWVDTFVAPFMDEAGKAQKYISIQTDITDTKATELQLIQTTLAAKEASSAKSQFLANMSHELRTPMNAILGMLALLGKTELSPRQADYTDKSNRAARSLLGLLNDILDFSKVEAGKMALDPHPFRLDQLLRNLSVILSSAAAAKPVELVFDIDAKIPLLLHGDQMRLQQILLNLGSNALKFTEQGVVMLSMHAEQLDDAQVTVQIGVRDSGIGIAPENQARIFDSFTQAEASTTRRFGGTGLGVAISQRLVTLMGGTLRLESTLGQGSLFYFTITLPLVPQTRLAEISTLPSAYPQPSEPLRIMVVDDHPVALEVLERMATSLGWTVDLADSAETALNMLQSRSAAGIHYQALFIDWLMPGFDGWETCQRIRALQLPDQPLLVMMVTAHGREILSLRSAAEQALFDGYVVKPATASMLLDAMVDARSSMEQPPSSPTVPPASGNRLADMHLLVVEDNLINQQVARELLQNEGATVLVAHHGQEAVDILSAPDARFDVVLMDLQMPVMDGLTATRVIRQDLGLHTLAIVAMTANAMESDREACLAAGMNDHVGKPFDLNHLVYVLRKHTGRAPIPESAPAVDVSALPHTVNAAAAVAGVDLITALARLGDKRDVYLRLLRTFVTDIQTIPAKLHAHAAAGQLQEISRLLHTLKGLAATLGVSELAAVAAQAEKQLALHNSAHDLITLAQHMDATLTSTVVYLDKLLQALQKASPAPPIAGAAAAGANRPLDTLALRDALKILAQQLHNSDMAALQSLADIQLQFGDALGDQLNALEEPMSTLDFQRALFFCSALIESPENPAA